MRIREIRTLGTGLNGARVDVCVQGLNFCPETEGRTVLRPCGQPVRFPVQSKREWPAFLEPKVVSIKPYDAFPAAKLVRT
jgi:hypothetical protein